MIRLDGVSVRFGDRVVLHDISLDLPEKRIAVIGANGSGKSTFARLLNGLLVATKGSVAVDGFDTRKNGRDVRRRVGFVFQNPDNQIVFPVVDEDIRFGLTNYGFSPAETERAVVSILERFGLQEHRYAQAQTLSGGEKQLLALAGVLVMEPRYLICDEPTTLLDLRNRNRVIEAIGALDIPVVVVTHDLDWARGFDRVIVFENGRIVADGEADASIATYRTLME